MGLFKSDEEKEQKAIEREQKILSKYNLQDITDPSDIESIKKIVQELAGSGFGEVGIMLSGTAEDKMKINYLRTVIEQNFVMMRQLDHLNRNLNQLVGIVDKK